jgi:NADH-quinone oxidoreductase subunit N
MNAPTIWIIAPAALALVLLFTQNKRLLSLSGGTAAALLAVTAQFIPLEQAFRVGGLSLRIESSLNILGRQLIIQPSEGPLLTLIYGATALWFFGAEASKSASKFVPLGLLITSLMIASIAVEPFLYAALFIEIVVLLSVPLITSLYQPPGKGITRFLIYHTLAMPFILLSGWLLAGVETSPGNLSLVAQSAAVLGLGFAFLLSIFPLYNWMPMLMEEAPPFAAGFLFWLLPTVTLVFGVGFLDRYSWLRASPELSAALRYSGLLMLVSGGVWAALQNHLGRIMAYGAIAETGFALLALSLNLKLGLPIFFLLFPSRALGLVIWSLALTIVKEHSPTLRYSDVRGMLRQTPVAAAAIVLASLSVSGLPLLAGFPPRLALWESLARTSPAAALWVGIGIAGLLTTSFRMLAVFSLAEEYTTWQVTENWLQTIMLGLGVIALFFLGVFPQTIQYFFASLPSMFEHLGR